MISPVKIWRRQKKIRQYLGKTGRILTWTRIQVAASDFKHQVPYPVVLVEFKNKERAVGQLVDYQEKDLKIGTKVISVLRRVRRNNREEIISYGLKFKPVEGQ